MSITSCACDIMQLEEQKRVIEEEHRRLTKVSRVLKEKDDPCDEDNRTLSDCGDAAESSRMGGKTVSGGIFALPGAEFISGFGKNDRLIPVITLVIYYGADEWNAPRSLSEMYAECDETVLKYAVDYKMNLIAPYHMSDEELSQFHTSLRQVMTYIKYSKDKEKLRSCMEQDENFRDLDREAAEVIREMTNARFSLEEGKERVDMCLAEEQMIEEGREEGRAEGRAEGRVETARSLVGCIESAIKSFHITLDVACKALGTTVDNYEKSKALLK